MRVSVFSPSHDTRYLNAAYESLRDQSFSDWEWIVLLNRKAGQWKPPEEDPRVKVSRAPSRAAWRGRAEARRVRTRVR